MAILTAAANFAGTATTTADTAPFTVKTVKAVVVSNDEGAGGNNLLVSIPVIMGDNDFYTLKPGESEVWDHPSAQIPHVILKSSAGSVAYRVGVKSGDFV